MIVLHCTQSFLLLLLSLFVALSQCGEIDFTQPDGLQCGTSFTIQWTFDSDTMMQLDSNEGPPVVFEVELWKDTTGFSNKIVAKLGEVTYPLTVFDWQIPKTLPEDWARIYTGDYDTFIKIKAKDGSKTTVAGKESKANFDNAPGFFGSWKDFLLSECIDPLKKDCIISEWGQYEPCQPNCGSNGKQRRRKTIIAQPEGGGQACPDAGGLEDPSPKPCTGLPDCVVAPVDCQVSEWSAWTACTSLCGNGQHTRMRTVTREPNESGTPCPTVLNMSGSCNGATENPTMCQSQTGASGCLRCACRTTGSACDTGLICKTIDGQGSGCVPASAADTTPGTEYSVCRTTAPACNQPLACIDNICTTTSVPACPVGQLNCPCNGNTCNGDAQCSGGVCVPNRVVMVFSPPPPAEGFFTIPVIVGFAAGGCLCCVCVIAVVVVLCFFVLSGNDNNGPPPQQPYNPNQQQQFNTGGSFAPTGGYSGASGTNAFGTMDTGYPSGGDGQVAW